MSETKEQYNATPAEQCAEEGSQYLTLDQLFDAAPEPDPTEGEYSNEPDDYSPAELACRACYGPCGRCEESDNPDQAVDEQVNGAMEQAYRHTLKRFMERQ